MFRSLVSLISMSTFLALSLPVCAQTYQPKKITFEGESDYSQQELLSASGFKPGEAMTNAQINEHIKSLLDSGLFENITYAFNSQDLTIKLVPSAAVYPLRFENLPILDDAALEARLMQAVPLYRGKVPAEGALLESVRKQLETELAAKGVHATITTNPYSDIRSTSVSAVGISIENPPVTVGRIHLQGASEPFTGKLAAFLAKTTGTPFSTSGSPGVIEKNVQNFYQELGYLESTADVKIESAAVSDEEGVHVPFSVTVIEGLLYKLSDVKLAPDVIVSQSDFDKQSEIHRGDVASLEKLRADWKFLEHRYHNTGHLKAVILATPTYNQAQSTVSYQISAVPGPVYTMGMITVLGVTEDLRTQIISAWPIPNGAPFNEGAILSMTATQGVNPSLERMFHSVDVRYSLKLHEETHVVDLTLRLERNH